jgi:FMN phosphatase YigB (HAD superfamily)
MNAFTSGIRLVSWDVDGTLFSYWRIVAPVARELARAGARQGWGNVARRFSDAWRFHRQVERQRRRPGATVDAAALERSAESIVWERGILDAALAVTRPRRRAVWLMERFRQAGVTQVALSDFECGSKVKRLGLAPYIAETYSCERLGFWKPSPVSLARIQEDFRVSPREHLHIGDRLDTDGAACVANGCRFMPIDRLPRAWTVFNAICAVSALE